MTKRNNASLDINRQGKRSLYWKLLKTKIYSVFIRLLSDFSTESVKVRIVEVLINRFDENKFICFFETIGELHT